MRFGFQAVATIELEYSKEQTKSKLVASQITIDVSANLNKRAYINEDGAPTADGAKAMTNTFIAGLTANIHHSQKYGYWNESDHIRFIIEELQKGFVAQVKTTVEPFSPIVK